MSLLALWLGMILLIGSAIAIDVPFVFDETSVDVTSYTSAELEQARTSSPDLTGVPIVSSPSDNEVLAFPVTGGGSTPEGATDKKVGELKDSLSARVEPDNSVVRHEAVVLAAKYPGDRTIDQISSIYSYLKNGADSKKGWSYVADTRGIDNFMYANETLEIGKDAGCVGAGDCDDFAILMSALVESIGGTTRIILARNNTTGGHAYTEVYLGNLDALDSQVENIISWLKKKFDTDKIYTHIDTNTKDVWLNLDWGADEKGTTHPGGPFYQGDKHIVLLIRDRYVKTALTMSEPSKKEGRPTGFTQDSKAEKNGIVEAAEEIGLKEFSVALEGAGLEDTLNNQGVLKFGSGSFVIFAPSDEAFAEVNDSEMNAINENATELKRILSYHIVWNDGRFENISELPSAKTLQGENLILDFTEGMKVNGANVMASKSYDNGTIYMIDKMLLPKTDYSLDATEAANDLGAKKFASAINSVGLAETLNGQGLMGSESLSEGPFTVFAPSDSAFDNAKATLDAISKKDAGMMNLLSYHMVDAKNLLNLTETNSAKTMQGDSLAVDLNMGLVGGANVLKSERYANGIVYVIDQVLVPIRLAM